MSVNIPFEYNEKLIDSFLRAKLKSDKSKRDYKREILKFIKFIGMDYLDIKSQLVCENYINHLIEKTKLPSKDPERLSMATVEKIYSYLFSFFTYLEEKLEKEGTEFYNYFQNIEKPTVSRNIRDDKIISWEELDKLISVLKEGKDRDFLALMLIFTSGLTVKEVTSLRWEQFVEDGNGNVGIEFELSNGFKRYAKVKKDIWILLNKYRGSIPVSSRNHVFLNKYNKPISSRWLRKVLHDACEEAGLSNIYTPRDLRHSAAFYQLKSGADPEKVKEQMGWSDVSLAKRYEYRIPELEDNPIDYVNFTLKK